MADLIGLALKDKERRVRLRRAQTDLYWLATEVLGFDLLTRDFHLPMLAEMDVRHRPGYRKWELWMWPRDYYKTTCMKARCVQAYLRDPRSSIVWWHAVEDRANESGAETGNLFLECDELRRLFPEMMPSRQLKKFVGSGGFRLPSCPRTKPASMRTWGAGSEATGGHADIGVVDDCIGLNDIEDNAMPVKRRWFGQTVTNVLRTGSGRAWVIGTHWDVDDLYTDFRKSKRFDSVVRGCYETDGAPDINGEPILYTRQEIEDKRSTMSEREFFCQMMNTPLPQSQRIWDQTAENFVSMREAKLGSGRYFVIGDPAPREIGGLSSVGERKRADGSKDWWSWCVGRLRVLGDRFQVVLVDGSHSQDWRTSEGMDEGCRLMRRWQTNMLWVEKVGGAGDFSEPAWESARRNGVNLFVDRERMLPRFAHQYAAGAKNSRFEMLADMARRGDFLISDECPRDFLYGDGEKTGFLTQARTWRTTTKGTNTLRWDDDADVVSRLTDPALREHAPRKDASRTEDEGWSPFRTKEQEQSSGSLWVQW